MQISKNNHLAPTIIKSKKPLESKTEPKEGSVLRDLVSIGSAAAAGTAGGVYGLAEGSFKGAKGNYSTHIKKGAELGKKILTPVGGAIGAIATGLTVSIAAVGAPVAAVLSTGLGFLGGATVSTAAQLPDSISQTARAGAQRGANAGRALGAVGAIIGTAVGGTIGAVGGLFVAAGKGIPNGIEAGKQSASFGEKMVTGVPQFAKNTWNLAYNNGRAAAGGVGAVLGGSAGAITATGKTIVDGVVGGVERGTQWGQNTSQYIQGYNS